MKGELSPEKIVSSNTPLKSKPALEIGGGGIRIGLAKEKPMPHQTRYYDTRNLISLARKVTLTRMRQYCLLRDMTSTSVI